MGPHACIAAFEKNQVKTERDVCSPGEVTHQLEEPKGYQ